MLETDRSNGDRELLLVLRRSGGGPYVDDAFLSGWRPGDIAATRTMAVEPCSDPARLSVTLIRVDDLELTTPGQD